MCEPGIRKVGGGPVRGLVIYNVLTHGPLDPCPDAIPDALACVTSSDPSGSWAIARAKGCYTVSVLEYCFTEYECRVQGHH